MDEIPINPRATLRRRDDEIAYAKDKLAGNLERLYDAPSLSDFKYWRIIDNKYPYTVAYKTCHMLLPKRLVATEDELTYAEIRELWRLKEDVFAGLYDQLVENMPRSRSVLDHYHIHLVTFYDSREEMGL
jgi:diadenosine tetraphosphate (Ap4A) HIT family hydrolase